jgi:hypothetical protein
VELISSKIWCISYGHVWPVAAPPCYQVPVLAMKMSNCSWYAWECVVSHPFSFQIAIRWDFLP